MRIALDTSAYSAFEKGTSRKLKSIIDSAEVIAVPFIVDAELRYGFKQGSQKEANYLKLKRFEEHDRVILLWPDEITNELYAEIWLELKQKGKPIPINDVWIAALCLQQQVIIVTNDSHFKSIPIIETVDYQ